MANSAQTNLHNCLQRISVEMMALIEKYKLEAEHPLEIIPSARALITDKEDYVRFIELSLEGRLIGEVSQHMEHAEQATPNMKQ